jgi:DNA-binding NarL/FixJ family response regulator
MVGATVTASQAREDQILRRIAFGLTNEEIARSLGIGVETVKEHVQKMLRKLKLPDRTAAAGWLLAGCG